MFRSELTNAEYLRLFTDEEIISSVLKNEYLVEILADEIRGSISTMDEREQLLFSDLSSDDKICEAHTDIYGAMDTIALLLDSGYMADIALAIMEDKGDW